MQSLSPRSLELRGNFQTHRWSYIWEDTENRVISVTKIAYIGYGQLKRWLLFLLPFHSCALCIFISYCCLCQCQAVCYYYMPVPNLLYSFIISKILVYIFNFFFLTNPWNSIEKGCHTNWVTFLAFLTTYFDEHFCWKEIFQWYFVGFESELK
jgi:hypothetical protein